MSSPSSTYDITASIYETVSSMWATYTLNMWHHSHYLCHQTHCIDYITPTLLWHHTGHMCGIVCIIQDITASHFDLKPPFGGHHTHYIRHRVHCICVITPLYRWYHSHSMYDITSSICETFCPLYLWHHIHYVWQHNPVDWLHHTRHMYEIICTTEDITFCLSHHATIFMTSHPLQACHHSRCIRLHTNCIFVIKTSPLISHPLLNDITPTICVTSYVLYITSYPLLMSSHYCI